MNLSKIFGIEQRSPCYTEQTMRSGVASTSRYIPNTFQTHYIRLSDHSTFILWSVRSNVTNRLFEAPRKLEIRVMWPLITTSIEKSKIYHGYIFLCFGWW